MIARQPKGEFLVVDDEPIVARGLVRTLRSVRTCVVAHSAEAAEPLLADPEHRWCGFLFDIVLEGRSGLDLLEFARMRHPRVPALVMSGQAEPSVSNRTYALGSAFVAKPIGALEMQRFLREAVTYDTGLDAPLHTAVSELAHQRRLTPAETELFAMAMLREPTAQMIELRGVTENTHKTQVRSLLKKLDAPTLDEACRRLMKGTVPRAG